MDKHKEKFICPCLYFIIMSLFIFTIFSTFTEAHEIENTQSNFSKTIDENTQDVTVNALERKEVIVHDKLVLCFITSLSIFLLLLYKLKDSQKLALFLTIIIILFLICILYSYIKLHFTDVSITKFLLEYLAVLFSGISIILVVSTLHLQRKQLQDSNTIARKIYDMNMFNIINELLSEELRECRTFCHGVKYRLQNKHEDTIHNLLFAFETQITDDRYNNPKWDTFKNSHAYKEYVQTLKFIRYFDTVSHYDFSENTAHHLLFHYCWWRSFLADVEKTYKQAYQNASNSKLKIDAVIDPTWTNVTERLDTKLAQYNLFCTCEAQTKTSENFK